MRRYFFDNRHLSRYTFYEHVICDHAEEWQRPGHQPGKYRGQRAEVSGPNAAVLRPRLYDNNVKCNTFFAG